MALSKDYCNWIHSQLSFHIGSFLDFLLIIIISYHDPLRKEKKKIFLTLVNYDFFNILLFLLQVFMNPGSPMPPIASSWLKYHSSVAEGWATPYDRNIIAFKDLVPNVASKDTIDLDDQ